MTHKTKPLDYRSIRIRAQTMASFNPDAIHELSGHLVVTLAQDTLALLDQLSPDDNHIIQQIHKAYR